MDESRLNGFDIALAGIDGVGKSTVSDALATELRERGYVVSVVSWRDYLNSGSSASGPTALRATYIAMLQSLYSAAIGRDGGSVEHLMPSLEQDFFGTHDGPLAIDDPSGEIALDPQKSNLFLASGLLEAAARMVERETVIAPALARGEVVIQESHGLKTCLKLGLVAQHLNSGDAAANRVVEDYLAMVRRCLTEWSRPSLSVLVTGDPRLAYAWRKRQQGFIARGEHLDENGHPAEWTFVELQTRIQEQLVTTADTEGWPRVAMTDRPQNLNVTSAVQVVLDALADRGILPVESVR